MSLTPAANRPRVLPWQMTSQGLQRGNRHTGEYAGKIEFSSAETTSRALGVLADLSDMESTSNKTRDSTHELRG